MFRSQHTPLFCLFASLLLSVVHPVHGEQADGFTVQERPGIVLVKPRPWSKDSEATVFEFLAFTDRRAVGTPGAGYYEFRTKQVPKRQVVAATVVKLIVYPNVGDVKSVMSSNDRDALLKMADELTATMGAFSATRAYLEPHLAQLKKEIEKFDGGMVKIKGQWVKRSTYEREQAVKLAGLLRGDIAGAQPPSSFDLENDARYIGLKELAASNDEVKGILADVAETQHKRLRAERRADLLKRLADPALAFAQAQIAVDQLKAQKPEEDPRSVAFLKSWDEGLATVKSANAQAATLAAALDAEWAAVPKDAATAPKISKELNEKIAELNRTMSGFVASRPPQSLVTEARNALAVCQTGLGADKLATLFEKGQYLDAKELLDTLSRQARLVGPNATRVVMALQVHVAGLIEEFNRRREEGELLAESKKPAEALAAYEAAYAVIPDPSLAGKISELKETLKNAKP